MPVTIRRPRCWEQRCLSDTDDLYYRMAIILVTTVASKFPSVRLRYMTSTCNEQRALLDVARCSKQNERILSSSLNMVRINQILNAILFTETC